MINSHKLKFTSFKPIELAIIVNAIGINFMKFVPFGLCLLLLACLFETFIVKTASIELKSSAAKKSLVVLSLPFLLAIFGLIFTANLNKAFEDISRLLPFILFPILLLCISNERKEKLNNLVLASFIFGLLIRFAMNFYESALGYLEDYNVLIFFYSYLDSDTNILAIVTMFGVLYLLDFMAVKSNLGIKTNSWIHGLVLFLSLCVLLLQSRIVILFFFASLGVLFIINWRNQKKWSILLTMLFSGLIMLIPEFQGRFQVISTESKSIKTIAVTEKVQVENLPCMSSTQLRLNSLKTSWKIIQKNPFFGVGTGDWRDELVVEYIASNMPCNAHEQTAPHNQYLKTLLKYGVVGLLIYLGYLFYLYHVYRRNFRFGQLPFLITLIFCGLGYDLMDVGSSAPVLAFFSSWLFFENK
jgi:O-antigen ligase